MMENTIQPQQSDIQEAGFIDRRQGRGAGPGSERRQFSPSYETLSPEAQELGEAVDQYKLLNRRRYINYEELLSVVKSIGYSK